MSSVSAAGSQAYNVNTYQKQQQKAASEPTSGQPEQKAEALRTSGDKGRNLNITA